MSVHVQIVPSDHYQTPPEGLSHAPLPEELKGLADAYEIDDTIPDTQFLALLGAALSISTIGCFWMAVTTS